MKYLLLYLLFSIGALNLHSQEQFNGADVSSEVPPKPRLVSNPHLDLSVGPIYGMHPNLRNVYPKGYYFVEGKGSASVMGLPFSLSFRQSDEDLRFGRSSYFKLSFDPQAYSRQQVSGLSGKLGKLEALIAEKQQLLYSLEAKLSYLYQKKNEYDAKMKLKVPSDSLNLPSLPETNLNLPDLNIPDLSGVTVPDLGTDLKNPELPSVPDLPQMPQAPEIPSLKALDSLSGMVAGLQKTLEGLKEQQLKLKGDYSRLTGKLPLDFLGGIRKLDFGQTTLGKSSMSGNAVPINGVHVKYAGENYFTDLAAGYTLPNQLFSSQAFDQLLYNSGNIFNLSNFFQVTSVRFVSSALAGYGKENGNHVAVENFYSGLPFRKTAGNDVQRSFTSNVTTRYSPAGWKNLTLRNTVGVTWTTPKDSSGTPQQVRTTDKISLYSSATVNFPKIKSVAEGSYRRIPSGYDGFIQGIYLKQTSRTEFSYKQAITRNLRTTLRVSRELFYLGNAENSRRLIHQASLDAQLKLGSHMSLTGSYSLLQLQERAVVVSPRSDVSHLGRVGLATTHEIARHNFTTMHDISYAEINGFDSVQRLVQANAKYALEFSRLRLGLQFQYSDFSGLTRLYGRNLVVQPEIGLKLEHFSFSAAWQQLWSDQFKSGYGMVLKSSFSFSQHIDFDFLMQRFLPTEYALFIDPGLDYRKPLFVKLGLNIHL